MGEGGQRVMEEFRIGSKTDNVESEMEFVVKHWERAFELNYFDLFDCVLKYIFIFFCEHVFSPWLFL